MRLYELSALMQTGETCALDRESVLSAVIEEALGEGFPLGKTPSKRFTLRLAPYIYPRAEKLMGALMRLKLQTEEGEVLPAGVFRVTEVEREPKQVTLYGADEMSLKMEEGFTDRLSYPMTLKGLVMSFAALAGCPLAEGGFISSQSAVSARPEWKTPLTLRQAARQTAAAIGGLIGVDYSGEVYAKSLNEEAKFTLAPGRMSDVRLGSGEFCLNALEYKRDGESVTAKTDASKPFKAYNSLSLGENPLLSGARINAVLGALSGIGFKRGEVITDEEILPQAGDSCILADESGAESRLLVTSLRASLTGGLWRLKLISALPTGESASPDASRRLLAPEGGLNPDVINNFASRVAVLVSTYIENLSAQQIKTGGLLAKFIDAAFIRAQEISSTEATTDSLTAMAAEIVNATVRKLSAGTVASDELSAGTAKLLAAKINSLTAGSIRTDELASALAAFTVITAGCAAFDRATVTNLLANALHLEYGAGGDVFIKNLSADYAKLVRAWVGNLCVRAADGKYYLLNVGADGSVSASEHAGMRQRQSGSVYSTLVNDTGFHIDREGAAGHLASFAGNGLGVEQITLGSIRAKRTSTRGWAWQIFD
ncbi:MAG: hypothetical protein IKI24_01250 [Clostridia bacterium]|nr:hypothetical protein [Clostridia bacterium]